MTETSNKDIKRLVKNNNMAKPIKSKKKMKTSKKAFWLGMTMSIGLIIFSAVMILMDKDTSTVSIFGGAGVACIPVLFGIYERYSNQLSLKHMEMDYNPNYDNDNNLY